MNKHNESAKKLLKNSVSFRPTFGMMLFEWLDKRAQLKRQRACQKEKHVFTNWKLDRTVKVIDPTVSKEVPIYIKNCYSARCIYCGAPSHRVERAS